MLASRAWFCGKGVTHSIMKKALINLGKRKYILPVVLLILAIAATTAVGLANYNVTVNPSQRSEIHSRVENLKDELFAAMGRQIEIDSISYGGALENNVFPFLVRNDAGGGGGKGVKMKKKLKC